MATEDKRRSHHDRTNHPDGIDSAVIDDVTRETVRGMAETAPPKSLDTIRAAGAVTEAAVQDHVRRRAYDMWTHEGRPPGNGVKYWVRAEKEVLEKVRAG